MDGWVTIGTRLDSKQLEKDIKTAESELRRYEKEGERLTKQKAKIDLDLEDYEKQKELIEQSYDNILKRAETEEQVNNVLGMEEEAMKSLNEAYSSQLNAQAEINSKIENNTYQQGLLNSKIEEMNGKLVKSKGMDKLKENINDTGKSVEKVTKKITKMALAVFGIRSAFMFVRRSISTLTENDSQLKADVDYIRTALAYSIEPLVRGIVELAKRLLYYVGYIIKAWTGYDIFANVSKALGKSKDEAKGLNKELNKTLAGFDEMNTLSSSSGGGDDGITPSFDFSDIENQPVPEWLEWIAKHKDEVITGLAGISAGLIGIHSGLTLIKGIGLGIAVAGLVRTVQKLIDFIKKPTFKNFMGILEGIAITVTGIGILFGAWPVAIAGAIALIVVELINHFDEVKAMFGRLIKWIDTDFRDMMRKVFGPLGDLIVNPFKWAVQFISDLFNGLFGGMKQIIDGIVLLFRGDFKGGISEIFSGMLDILMAPFNSMKTLVNNIFTEVVNFIIDAINVLIDGLNKIKIPGTKIGVNLKRLDRIGEHKYTGGGFRAKGGIFYPSKLPKLAVGGIINQPGRGVPYNGAYIGERGAEAVVPLTDSQQMALLGETIGRYVNISATIPVYVGNRKVAREVRKIQANEDFAFNR